MNTFAKYQDSILADWSASKTPMHTIFNSSDSDNKEFHFIAGPPFPTGKPHLGHVAVETIKSTILNYKSMRGFACENRIGYDCHGLPIESIANRELSIQTREELEAIGLTKFNTFCKEKIASFEGDWEPVYNRLGRWVDFDNTYRTMDKEFMESVWWAFSELYKKGLIYRGYKITPYSYALQSPLSNFEATQNYKEVDCRSVYVRFLVNDPKIITLLPSHLLSSIPTGNTLNECHIIDNDLPLVYIIIWTTTPWTLPANLAVCINASLEYDIIQIETGEIYILGKNTWNNIGIKSSKIIKTILGAELVGLSYEPPFFTYNRLYYGTTNTPRRAKWFSILADNYVRAVEPTQPGTGIVHLAPLFGEDDFRVCKEQNVITESDMQLIELIDSSGNITHIHPFANADTYDSKRLILDTETDVIKELKSEKTLVKIQQIRHEYPYCYRTDTPLIYRACHSFYVDIQSIKPRMIELNRGINWIPEHVGAQRFHNWLEGAKDWCISRSRFFGTPIPVWQSEDGSDIRVISCISELEELTNTKLADIHPEHVNHLEFTINGKRYTRVLDIFDCWFESGAVPFAQHYYPFNPESRTRIDSYIENNAAMCDFIAEGLDQTRGWFYTLLVLSTALFNVAPAKNILTVGLVLDSQKRKISKKLGNYVDVEQLLETHGTDTIRLYILQSGITAAEPLAFREDDLAVISKTLYQFKNCWDFLAEHITNMQHQGHSFNPTAYLEYQTTDVLGAMDKWIICYMNNLTQELTSEMDNFKLSHSARALLECVENITNWYLKFNRDRLKGKAGIDEWRVSASVLYQVIRKWCILAAPFAPFFSQWIYQLLQCVVYDISAEWIHQQSFSDEILLEGATPDFIMQTLSTFNLLQRVARMVRAARMKTTTHTSSKTPIKRLEICMDNPIGLDSISSCIDLIQSELNVIDIAYSPLEGNIAYRVVPNKALLGKKYKKLAIDIYKALESLETTTHKNNKETKTIKCSLENEQEVCLSPDEYTLEPIFGENDIYDNATVAPATAGMELNILARIDFTFNKEIESLAVVRRFIAHIQQSRKNMGLHPWNPISIEINNDDFDIIHSNREYIQQRLECNVNYMSSLSADRKFTLGDEEDSRVIAYMILRL